jgi:hypothetical protein
MDAIHVVARRRKSPASRSSERRALGDVRHIGERRRKHSIIAQNAVGRDNFGFLVQRTQAVAATVATGFLQE